MRTDETGKFRIENVRPGAYRLELATSSDSRTTTIYREDILVLDRHPNRFDLDIETGAVHFVLNRGGAGEVQVWISANARKGTEPKTWLGHPSFRAAAFENGTASLARVTVGRYRFAIVADKRVLSVGEVRVLRANKTPKVTVRWAGR